MSSLGARAGSRPVAEDMLPLLYAVRPGGRLTCPMQNHARQEVSHVSLSVSRSAVRDTIREFAISARSAVRLLDLASLTPANLLLRDRCGGYVLLRPRVEEGTAP